MFESHIPITLTFIGIALLILSKIFSSSAIRLVGVGALFFSALHGVLIFLSIHGPNHIALARETRQFLIKTHGPPTMSSNIHYQTSTEPENIVEYTYEGKSGKLVSKWNGEHYIFTEFAKN